jgi:hypothetical protein
MTTYEFGVMSQAWTLEAEDMVVAQLCMVLHVNQNVIIAIYSPQGYAFWSGDFLKHLKPDCLKKESIIQCLKTIKAVQR